MKPKSRQKIKILWVGHQFHLSPIFLSKQEYEKKKASVPALVGGACPEAAAALVAGTLAAVMAATGTVSTPARGPVGGFASIC